MKALSVRQPWAWAIIHAGKDIENRTRITRYRGPVAIHATRCGREEYEDAAREIQRIAKVKVPDWQAMRATFGTVIGAVELVNSWEEDPTPRSKWATGPAYWELGRPWACKPYACKGARGYLFDIPDGVIESHIRKTIK